MSAQGREGGEPGSGLGSGSGSVGNVTAPGTELSSSSSKSLKSMVEKFGRLEGRGVEILKLIGFQYDVLGKEIVTGRFVVSENSCQPFGVLHGGTTAFVAESIASLGAAYASNFERVAGIELNVNHLRPAPVGNEILVTAAPLLAGNRIQVWEVKFETEKRRKGDIEAQTQPTQQVLVAVARVTLIVGVPKKD